jgi:hypothetical protein
LGELGELNEDTDDAPTPAYQDVRFLLVLLAQFRELAAHHVTDLQRALDGDDVSCCHIERPTAEVPDPRSGQPVDLSTSDHPVHVQYPLFVVELLEALMP